MSQHALRPEKNCLNCGATVEQRYCPLCGQENINPRESFWHLLTHFVYDLFHFDGKFFATLKHLLFKPGFLSQEHLKGRRASYLHPIRLYVFTSAFFFFIFFAFYNVDEEITINDPKSTTVSAWMKRYQKATQELTKARAIATKLGQQDIVDSLNKELKIYREDSLLMRKDSVAAFKKPSIMARNQENSFINISGDSGEFSSEAAYDSAQAQLPKEKRRNWLVRKLVKKNIHWKQKFKGDNEALAKAAINIFIHRLAQTFFTSLPLFALLLQLLYVRRRQQYLYVDHLVYTIHLYCATFILTLCYMWLGSLVGFLSLPILGYLGWAYGLLIFWYGYKAMRQFYGQSRRKTLFKYFLLAFLFSLVMVFVFLFFFVGSALTL